MGVADVFCLRVVHQGVFHAGPLRLAQVEKPFRICRSRTGEVDRRLCLSCPDLVGRVLVMINARTVSAAFTASGIGRGGVVRDPRILPVLDLGRRFAVARFSAPGRGSGVPARLRGDRLRPPVRTWPCGGQARRRAFSFASVCRHGGGQPVPRDLFLPQGLPRAAPGLSDAGQGVA